MKRFKVVVAGLIALASPVAAKEKAPTLTYDANRKTATIIGADHFGKGLLDRSTWRFALAIVDGQVRNPVLIYSSWTDDWYFFDHAADSDGNTLKVFVGPRDVDVPGLGVHETSTVELTADYVRTHRLTGMDIKFMGERGDKVVRIPSEAVTAFADGAVSIFKQFATPTK